MSDRYVARTAGLMLLAIAAEEAGDDNVSAATLATRIHPDKHHILADQARPRGGKVYTIWNVFTAKDGGPFNYEMYIPEDVFNPFIEGAIRESEVAEEAA